MSKFHITKNGEAKPCYANVRACPVTDANEHFDTKEEARTYYEKKMTAELLPRGTHIYAGKRELNQLAKFTSDNDIIEKALLEGSDTTFKALAKNPNAGMHHLVRAYNSANSDGARLALALHDRFPVEKLNPSEAAAALKKYGSNWDKSREIASANNITDEHMEALSSVSFKQLAAKALANPNNKLSQEKVIEESEKNWMNLKAGIDSGRYPISRIENLPGKLIYWSNIDSTTNPQVLDAYASWAEKNMLKDKHDSDYTANRIAMNPHTGPATLARLAANGQALTAVYKHPNARAETKQAARNISKEVDRVANIEELDKRFPNGGVKSYITVAQNTNQPYRNRGLYDSSIMLNTERVKELGLTKEDIFVIMNASQYNGGVHYNEETGVFSGTVDSTD